MKKLLLSICLINFLSFALTAQTERVDVTVHLKDGSTVEGMMEMNADYPWQTQKKIAVFDKSLESEKRIKNKQKVKYKSKDVDYFEVDGRVYESKKVTIEGRGDRGSTLKSLTSAYSMIERIVTGPITVYKGYGYPPDVVSGSFEDVYADLRANPEYFLMNEDDMKTKSMHNVDIHKWIKDAPETSEKFANGDYGNMKRKKKKKLGNFLKAQLENENPNLIIKVVKDYNDEIKKSEE